MTCIKLSSMRVMPRSQGLQQKPHEARHDTTVIGAGSRDPSPPCLMLPPA